MSKHRIVNSFSSSLNEATHKVIRGVRTGLEEDTKTNLEKKEMAAIFQIFQIFLLFQITEILEHYMDNFSS